MPDAVCEKLQEVDEMEARLRHRRSYPDQCAWCAGANGIQCFLAVTCVYFPSSWPICGKPAAAGAPIALAVIAFGAMLIPSHFCMRSPA